MLSNSDRRSALLVSVGLGTDRHHPRMALRAVEWHSYEPVDGGAAVQIAATLGALEPRRIDVEDGPDAVTITVYEDLPAGTTAIPLIGIGARFEVRLPTPLAGRRVVDGASGTRRRETSALKARQYAFPSARTSAGRTSPASRGGVKGPRTNCP